MADRISSGLGSKRYRGYGPSGSSSTSSTTMGTNRRAVARCERPETNWVYTPWISSTSRSMNASINVSAMSLASS